MCCLPSSLESLGSRLLRRRGNAALRPPVFRMTPRPSRRRKRTLMCCFFRSDNPEDFSGRQDCRSDRVADHYGRVSDVIAGLEAQAVGHRSPPRRRSPRCFFLVIFWLSLGLSCFSLVALDSAPCPRRASPPALLGALSHPHRLRSHPAPGTNSCVSAHHDISGSSFRELGRRG